MTVLEDTETAQYTHTLNVSGKLGGLYQCNVSNSMPSSKTASFVVMGMFSIFDIMYFYSNYSIQRPQLPLISWQSRKDRLASECLGTHPLH